MIYRRLGYVKVNRAARHTFWRAAYRAHAVRELLWFFGFFFGFGFLFLSLWYYAVGMAVDALMGR